MRRSIELPSALEGRTDDPAGSLRLALFLDYDGTLTPIVPRPEDARLSPQMRDVVAKLTRKCPVFIVSGRDRADVARLVGIEGPGYVGSHGFDILGPPGSDIAHEVALESLPLLDAAEAELRHRTESLEGCLVERKRFGIAVHFRQVAREEVPEVDAIVESVGARHPRLRRAAGKMVFELRPDVDWDKGRAVLWLLSRLGLEDHHAIHLGDDLTDESVFEAITGRGTGIFVGDADRPTSASMRLADPDEVGIYLRGLETALP